jgi:pimeloyl-ACP methyl ester carboxylesterase
VPSAIPRGRRCCTDGFVPRARPCGVDKASRTMARIESMGALPLEAVSAPTLIIHGLGAANVPVEDAERAARLVRAAELVRVPNGLHLLPLADNASELAARREAFLRHYARTAPGRLCI